MREHHIMLWLAHKVELNKRESYAFYLCDFALIERNLVVF